MPKRSGKRGMLETHTEFNSFKYLFTKCKSELENCGLSFKALQKN